MFTDAIKLLQLLYCMINFSYLIANWSLGDVISLQSQSQQLRITSLLITFSLISIDRVW